MSPVCWNANPKTWTPLPDCYIDQHMVEVPTIQSAVTSAGQRHASVCDASPKSGNLSGSGQHCWLEQKSLMFHKLTAAWSHAPYGQKKKKNLFSKLAYKIKTNRKIT